MDMKMSRIGFCLCVGLSLVAGVWLAGCDNSNPKPADVAGTWNITQTVATEAGTFSVNGTLVLQQDGNNVTGTFSVTGLPVSGVVDGRHLSLQTAAFVNTESGTVVTGVLDGSVNGNEMKLTGVATEKGPNVTITVQIALTGTRVSQ